MYMYIQCFVRPCSYGRRVTMNFLLQVSLLFNFIVFVGKFAPFSKGAFTQFKFFLQLLLRADLKGCHAKRRISTETQANNTLAFTLPNISLS